MGDTTGSTEPASLPSWVRYFVAWLASALPAFLIITLLWLYFSRTSPFAYVAIGAFALAFPVMVRRLNVPRRVSFVYFLLLVGIAFGVLSILTGWGNGLTDEPFTTPRFAAFTLSGHDPYTTQLVFDYNQYGTTLSSQSYYLYLPLLMFLQIPGLDYKWFALGCWAVMVLLTRKQFDIATMLAQPYVLLIAASGYNDLPVLLLLTLGFVGVGGRRQKWAEYLSLGCKQFANAFVFVYYLVRRRWVDFFVTLGVSVAFLLPFLLWGGTAVICPAVFANRLSVCAPGGSPSLLLNYPVWAVWIVAVFYIPVARAVRSWSSRPAMAARIASWRVRPDRFGSLPALSIVAASAAGMGLLVFNLGTLAFGTAPFDVLSAGTLAVAGTVAWSLAWNGPWRHEPSSARPPTSILARIAESHLVLAAVALSVLGIWIAEKGAPLPGAVVALGLGVFVSGALLWAWDLRAPAPPTLKTHSGIRGESDGNRD